MSAMAFWGTIVKPGKTATKLTREEDASIVLKQVNISCHRIAHARTGTHFVCGVCISHVCLLLCA